jgi:hypothetical protein
LPWFTVASLPLWINLSLMAECLDHVERALARLNTSDGRDFRREMRLYAGLGMSLNYTTGVVSETAVAWTKTLEIAKGLGDTEYQLRAHRGLWAYQMNGVNIAKPRNLHTSSAAWQQLPPIPLVWILVIG